MATAVRTSDRYANTHHPHRRELRVEPREEPDVPVGATSAIPRRTAAPDAAPGREPGPEPPTLWRFGLGATLALAMGVGPLALYALSALSPFVIAELGLTRTQFGALATLAFVVSASLSVASGTLIDRVGGRRMLLLLFVTAGGALVAVTAAPTYAWLLVAVAATGFSQSLSNPVTNQVVAVLVPPGRRGLLMGIKQSGVQMAQFLAGATLPAAAAFVGWRAATSGSVVLVVVGIALVLVIVPTARAPVAAPEHDARVEAGRDALPPGVWWLTGYTLLMGAALQATNVYLPLYAFEEIGMSAVVAGATTGVMGAVGVVARIGWGRITEYVTSTRGPLVFLALAATAAVVSLGLASAGVPALLWLGIGIHSGTVMAANVVVMMALVGLVPPGHVGRASGILAVGMYVGFAAGPVSFGWLADTTGGYATGWGVLAAIYLVAAALIMIWSRGSAARPATVS
jgi:MFS family permease